MERGARGSREVMLAYGEGRASLSVPADALVLEAPGARPARDPVDAIQRALDAPIATPSLAEVIRRLAPRSAAIAVSDATRPIPYAQLLPPILDRLSAAGLPDQAVRLVVGTGMHRATTKEERLSMFGPEILERFEVVDHRADEAATLVRVSEEPPVSVCRAFASADLRIVTGLIEPHFMAGFSGGRKGVCPALVDLESIEAFHGYETLANSSAATGVLDGNPCHDIALGIARRVGVHFLVNVSLSADRRLSEVFAGDLEAAHEAACEAARRAQTVEIQEDADLIVVTGGGAPLDRTLYQTVKGMVAALPLLHDKSTMLALASCSEGSGSDAFEGLLETYGSDWRAFVQDISQATHIRRDQWQLQMLCRVLARVGVPGLQLACDGWSPGPGGASFFTMIGGGGPAPQRLQQALDQAVAAQPGARIAVVPDAPATVLRRCP